jgi:hypothetical protein
VGGSEFAMQIIGNPRDCRTEAEVSRMDGEFVAVVYESAVGWQVEPATPLSAEVTAAILAAAQARLRDHVNRRGENPPPGLTVEGCRYG